MGSEVDGGRPELVSWIPTGPGFALGGHTGGWTDPVGWWFCLPWHGSALELELGVRVSERTLSSLWRDDLKEAGQHRSPSELKKCMVVKETYYTWKEENNHGCDQASSRGALPHENMAIYAPPFFFWLSGVPGKMPGNQAGKSRWGSYSPAIAMSSMDQGISNGDSWTILIGKREKN